MPVDPLSATVAALADRTRRAILALGSGESTVTELTEPFRVTLSLITRQVEALEGLP
jgi:DNA-binding transcriptional ArsR family regulator